MSAVLLAVFDDYDSASRARTRLVFDGFPTDRVELTACNEPGRAGLEPGTTLFARVFRYFQSVCAGDRECAERLASALESGSATVTVHPRGRIEVARATEILEEAGAAEFIRHNLENQTFEHAAARQRSPWVSHFWVDLPPDPTNEAHCIYCRLFERPLANPA